MATPESSDNSHSSNLDDFVLVDFDAVIIDDDSDIGDTTEQGTWDIGGGSTVGSGAQQALGNPTPMMGPPTADLSAKLGVKCGTSNRAFLCAAILLVTIFLAVAMKAFEAAPAVPPMPHHVHLAHSDAVTVKQVGQKGGTETDGHAAEQQQDDRRNVNLSAPARRLLKCHRPLQSCPVIKLWPPPQGRRRMARPATVDNTPITTSDLSTPHHSSCKTAMSRCSQSMVKSLTAPAPSWSSDIGDSRDSSMSCGPDATCSHIPSPRSPHFCRWTLASLLLTPHPSAAVKTAHQAARKTPWLQANRTITSINLISGQAQVHVQWDNHSTRVPTDSTPDFVQLSLLRRNLFVLDNKLASLGFVITRITFSCPFLSVGARVHQSQDLYTATSTSINSSYLSVTQNVNALHKANFQTLSAPLPHHASTSSHSTSSMLPAISMIHNTSAPLPTTRSAMLSQLQSMQELSVSPVGPSETKALPSNSSQHSVALNLEPIKFQVKLAPVIALGPGSRMPTVGETYMSRHKALPATVIPLGPVA